MSERQQSAGLAFKYLKYGLLFATASLLFIVLNPAADALLQSGADITSSQAAADGHSYLSSAWDFLPVFTGLLALVFIIAGATGESRRAP